MTSGVSLTRARAVQQMYSLSFIFFCAQVVGSVPNTYSSFFAEYYIQFFFCGVLHTVLFLYYMTTVLVLRSITYSSFFAHRS